MEQSSTAPLVTSYIVTSQCTSVFHTITNNHSFLPSCRSCLLTSFFLVPLVISRASDLLNASSVSGSAASTQRQQQAERKDSGETCKETANMVSYRTDYEVTSCSFVTHLKNDNQKSAIYGNRLLLESDPSIIAGSRR